MKLDTKRLASVAALLAPIALAYTAAPTGQDDAAQPVLQDAVDVDEGTELEKHMEAVEQAVKRLRRSLRDESKRATSLELVSELQHASLACKDLVPRMTATQPEAERAGFQEAYRRQMVDFLAAQFDLEAALLDGDAEAAQAAFKIVRDMEEQGHERFTEEG